MHQQLVLLAAALLLLVTCPASAQLQLTQLPQDAPCFTGVAKLVMLGNECPPLLDPMANLSSPFDPSVHVPWDCLDELAVSVSGCVVSMVSMVNASQTLEGFSCSWLQFQGNLVNGTHARMQAWVRPSPVARYILGSDLEMASTDMLAPEKPKDWQTQLQAMIREASHLIADAAVPGYLQLSQLGGRCNSTYLVVEGGIMGRGTVNSSTMGMVVLPSPFAFESPYLVRGTFDSSWWRRRARSVVIALIVLVSVLGALLMACLALLAYRLCKAAGKRRGPIVAALPYANDGVAHIPTTQVDVGLTGASAIENGARRHQHTGGVHAGGL